MNFKGWQTVAVILAIAGTGTLQGDVAYVAHRSDCFHQPEYDTGCTCFFAGGDLLYFRAFEGGLSSICESTDITDYDEDGQLVSYLEGSSNDPRFTWNPGFRVGAGLDFGICKGEIGVFWTHFNTHSRKSRSVTNQHNWKINFDTVDLLYGYPINLNSCLMITPYGGLSYAKINQKLHAHTVSNITYTTDTTTTVVSVSNSKQYFYGLGPFVGVDGDFYLGKGFSLYGDFSIAFLYGTFRVYSNDIDTSSTEIDFNHLKLHTQAIQTVLDSGLGLRWRTCVCDRMCFGLQLGLETHRYFNQNQMCGYGDLSLDGATLGAWIEY